MIMTKISSKIKKIISRVFVTDKEYDNKDNHTHLLEIN